LILIRGLPGSGKSTLAKQLKTIYGESATHLEADQFFIDEQGNYEHNVDRLRWAHLQCENQTRLNLEKGRTVIVSNTFTVQRELKPYFQIANQLGIVPHVILCQTQYQSIHDVPTERLLKMKQRFTLNLDPLFEILGTPDAENKE